MSTSEATEAVSAVITTSNKLTNKKLDGTNYIMWRKVVSKSLIGMEKGDHLTDIKTGEGAKAWIQDDEFLYGQMMTSMTDNVAELVSHTESVKDLWEYLEVLYSGRDNLNRLNDLSNMCLDRIKRIEL